MEPIAPQSLHIHTNTSDNQDSVKKTRSSKLFQQPGMWLAHTTDTPEEGVAHRVMSSHAEEQEGDVAVAEETQTLDSIDTLKVPAQNRLENHASDSAHRVENREAFEHIETHKIPTPIQYPLFNNVAPQHVNNGFGQYNAAQSIPVYNNIYTHIPQNDPRVGGQPYGAPPYAPAHNVETPQAWYMPAYSSPPANNFMPGYTPVFPGTPSPRGIGSNLSVGRAAILITLLCIIVLQALNIGPTQFLGPRGWSYVLAGPSSGQSSNLLAQNKAAKDAQNKNATNPQQTINSLLGQMTLDQKIGQMMMVQFIGADYSLQLSTMISQYNVGSVLLFYANGNIVGKDQLKTLTQQIQQGSTTLPIAISIDQEGGTVDRLVQLDGPRPSAASIGATNDPTKAQQAGQQDAQDLSSYGINLNLAPVVDVDNLSTSEMHRDNRTYGSTPEIVSSMAGAYLKGLQQSGKVIGTLKHFPGLGYVNVDPHFGIPRLNRSKDQMEQIDWSPYRTLIQAGQVHAIMVTHEILPAIDATKPSSLSAQVVQGILRDEMHFQGVIMTDSLTMAGITQYYTPGQAAAIAVEAGSDMIMGANSPTELGAMIDGIKQSVNDGTISKTRIDDSVRRILMMKYQMGLLSGSRA